MKTKNIKSLLVDVGVIAVILILACAIFAGYRKSEAPPTQITRWGIPRHIVDLYGTSEHLYLLDPFSSTSGSYDLYCLSEDNNRRLLWSFSPSTAMEWNSQAETFWCLSDGEVYEFDPGTAQQFTVGTLQEKGFSLRAAASNRLFLRKAGEDTIYAATLPSLEITELTISGEILEVSDQYLFVWNSREKTLSCHNHLENVCLWEISLEDHFWRDSFTPYVFPVGGGLYVACNTAPGLYLIEDFTHSSEMKEFEFYRSVLAFCAVENNIFLAIPSGGNIELYKTSGQEEPELFASCPAPEYYSDTGVRMAESGGKLYCSADNGLENELFVFDLASTVPAEQK